MFFQGPEKLLEKTENFPVLLENAWNFEMFFQGSGKLLKKQIISLYYLIEKLLLVFAGVKSWKNKFFTLENSWNFVIS